MRWFRVTLRKILLPINQNIVSSRSEKYCYRSSTSHHLAPKNIATGQSKHQNIAPSRRLFVVLLPNRRSRSTISEDNLPSSTFSKYKTNAVRRHCRGVSGCNLLGCTSRQNLRSRHRLLRGRDEDSDSIFWVYRLATRDTMNKLLREKIALAKADFERSYRTICNSFRIQLLPFRPEGGLACYGHVSCVGHVPE